jgi:hypothetical protein
VEGADDDHQRHHGDLQVHQRCLEPRGVAHALVEDERDEQAEQHGEEVDLVRTVGDAVGLGARRAGHPQRQPDVQETEQVVEVAGDADGHHRHDRGVLQQQVPADEPADDLTEDGVAVGVGRAGARDEAGELGVGERRRGAGHAGDQERDQHRRAGGLVGHRAGQGEDAGADDAADADRGQLPQAERAVQPAAFGLLDLLDRLAPEDPGGHASPPPCTVRPSGRTCKEMGSTKGRRSPPERTRRPRD